MQEFVVVPERRPCLLRRLPFVKCELQSLSVSEFESLFEFEFELQLLSPFCANARRFILIVTFGVVSFPFSCSLFSFSLGFCFDFDFGVDLLLLFDLLLFACFGVCTSCCCCCCFFFGVACFLALLFFLLDLLLCLARVAYFYAQCLNHVRSEVRLKFEFDLRFILKFEFDSQLKLQSCSRVAVMFESCSCGCVCRSGQTGKRKRKR